MSTFVAIDFETANNRPNSACQLGVVVVENWKIVHEAEWLIRPPRLFFSPQCVRVHGITARECMNSPTWDRVWEEAFPLLDGHVMLGHNVGFDANVMLGSSMHYDIAMPTIELLCTRLIAKRTWPTNDGHGLANIARMLGIEFRHHNALEDARASAQVAILAAEKLGTQSVEEMEARLGLVRGRIWVDQVRNPRTIRLRRVDQPVETIGRSEPKRFRADGVPSQSSTRKSLMLADAILQRCGDSKPLEGKRLVLLHSLFGLERDDAISFLEKLGAIVQPAMNMQTHFVVLGTVTGLPQQRYLFADLDSIVSESIPDAEPPQLKELEQRKAMGQPIQLLSQRQLMALIPSGAEILRGT